MQPSADPHGGLREITSVPGQGSTVMVMLHTEIEADR